jgi:hypothetical protein
MLLKKTITVFVIFAFFLSGCATHNRTTSTVGPQPSSSYSTMANNPPATPAPLLEVIIPVFDPGLPEDMSEEDAREVWPELRRAEANRFALKMKDALEATGKFGAVRVRPEVWHQFF